MRCAVIISGSALLRGLLGLAAITLLSACSGSHLQHADVIASTQSFAEEGLNEPSAVADVEATCTVPLGWKAEPLKASGRHQHQVWLSPTGSTAFGVIHFTMPLPVGPDFVLPAFLNEMKRSEGESQLLSKQRDAELPGIRFVAQGGLYKIRGNLITHGFTGWVIYAGTLKGRAEVPDELALAERARERSRIGITSSGD